MLRLLVVAVLSAEGSSADAGVCEAKWKEKHWGCEYSMGTSPGSQYGDVVVAPMEVIGLATCGQRVTVCGVERVCRCPKAK